MPRDNPLFSGGMLDPKGSGSPLMRLSFFQNGADDRNE